MKIVVLIKSVPDTASVPEISADNRSIQTDRLEHVMNPYDEYALEEAVRLKEGESGEVVAISLGEGAKGRKVLRAALAVGADRALLVGGGVLGPFACGATAKVLAAVLRVEAPDLVFAGLQAVDDNGCQVPARVAELLGMPHASMVTRFSLNLGRYSLCRETEEGHHTVEGLLPALFTTQKGINTPRYPVLPAILKAKRKEIRELSLTDLSLDKVQLAVGLEVEAFSLQRPQRLGKILEGDAATQVNILIGLFRRESWV